MPTADRTDTGTKLGKDALLDAAARLFDEVGVDAVSINELVRASGHRNRSAVSYHFGTRDDVVRAVAERSMTAPDRRRHELLDELLTASPDPTLTELATVVLQPLSEQFATLEGRRHLRLLDQLLGHPRLLATAQQVLAGNSSLERTAGLVRSQLDHLTPEFRRERLELLVTFVIHAYAEQASLLDDEAPSRPPLSTDEFTRHIVGLVVAMVGAPSP